MSPNRPTRPRRALGRPILAVAASTVVLAAGLPTVLAYHESVGGGWLAPLVASSDLPGHPVISEVVTGGASASDELIELYNPQPEPMALEGLEVVYVTATGGTITRKAAFGAGSAPLDPGAHVLIANSTGVFVSLADQTYTGGLAATGGSVALRIQGATTAIDAVGWGNATSTWIEGTPAPAVAAGHSIERLPGAAAGSGQDTNDNAADFTDRGTPDPQNSLSAPIPVPTPAPTAIATPSQSAVSSPSATPTASASPTPTRPPTDTPSATPSATIVPTVTPTAPTPSPTAVPTATVAGTPSPTPVEPVTIAQARALGDGTSVVVEGIALTDSAFADGGGYLADGTAGIAVLLSDGTFARGATLRIIGVLDDRFSQRTIRADSSGLLVIGDGSEPAAQTRITGQIGEDDEGQLIAIEGTLTSAATQLTSGIAFDVDDGSGPIRVLVGSTSGIDTTTWTRGSDVHVQGVVGQRDSSGTGTAGYRLQPRDAADVLSLAAPTPTPTASGTSTPRPSPSESPNPAVISITAARGQPPNTRLTVRGVVTLPSGLVDTGTAAIQDSSGAIVLRLGDDAGKLHLGDLVEVAGTRSTKSGMETIRVVAPPRRLGSQSLPNPRRRDTGALGEQEEAVLVVVHGAVTTTPRRTSADNVYFDVDDGSGPIRIFAAPGAAVETESLLSGTAVVVSGVLGQETTGKLPERGYRLWPRRAGDLEIVSQPGGATATGGTAGTGGAGSASSGEASGAPGGPNAAAAGGTPGRCGPQQERPRLMAPSAAQTESAVRVSLPTAAAPDQTPASPPRPLAAGVLLLGGLLLLGSGVTTADPQLPGMLLARLRDWIGGHPDAPEGSIEEGPGADETAQTTLPRLVPLVVTEDGGASAAPVARAVREERERILPPT